MEPGVRRANTHASVRFRPWRDKARATSPAAGRPALVGPCQNLVKCSKHSWAVVMSANAATSERFTAR